MKKGLKNADFADKNSGSCKEVGLTQLKAPCLKDRICIPNPLGVGARQKMVLLKGGTAIGINNIGFELFNTQ